MIDKSKNEAKNLSESILNKAQLNLNSIKKTLNHHKHDKNKHIISLKILKIFKETA